MELWRKRRSPCPRWFSHFLVDEEIDRQSMRAMDNMSMAVYDYVPCYRSLAGTGCATGFATRE